MPSSMVQYADSDAIAYRAYHEASMQAINNQIRVYNGIAPYSVRRSAYSLEQELADCFNECAPKIQAELRRRVAEGFGFPDDGMRAEETGGKPRVANGEQKAVHERMWPAFKRLVSELVAR